jgi:MFS family permease
MNETVSCVDTPIGRVRKVHVLEERNMQWYLGTQLISLTGMMLRSSLLSLLLVDLLGFAKAGPYVGAVWALNVIPGTFLSIFAGVILDRYDKRKILQITAALSALQGAALAYLAYTDVHHMSISLIMDIALFGGFTNAIDGVGRNAIVKDAVVNHYNHRSGTIFFNSLYTFAMVVGNGLSGYLIVWIGYGNSFMLNAVSFMVLIFGLRKLNFDHHEFKETRPPFNFSETWRSIVNGGRYTFTEPGIRICILLAATITVFGFAYNVILTIVNQAMFHGGPKEYSHLAMSAGIGSLIGSIVAILFSTTRPKTFVIGGCLTIGIGQIALAHAPNSHWAIIALAVSGFGFMSCFLPVRGAIMHIVKKELIGIVLGFTFMFFYGGMMVSSMGAGWLAKNIGCPAVLNICGAVLILTAIATPFLPGIKEIEKN